LKTKFKPILKTNSNEIEHKIQMELKMKLNTKFKWN
jgi:hypothetical protein